MNTKALALLCTPALIAFVGCSSDVTFSSGVDGAKKISEVTPDEAQSICDASAAAGKEFAEANKDGFCAFAASLAGALGSIGGGDPAALCETALDECKAQPLTTETGTCNAATAAAGCEATVAELEDCYNESLKAAADFYSELGGKSCTELTMPSTGTDVPVTSTPPAACTALATKCPSFNVGIPSTGTSTAS